MTTLHTQKTHNTWIIHASCSCDRMYIYGVWKGRIQHNIVGVLCKIQCNEYIA